MDSQSIIIFTDISLNEIAYGYDTTEVGTAHIRDADDGWAILQALQDESLNLDSVLVAFGDAWPWLNSSDAPEDLRPDPSENWTSLDPQVSWVRGVVDSLGDNNVLVEKGSILQYQFDSSLSPGAQRIVDRIRDQYDSDNPVSLVGIGTATDILKVINELNKTDDLDLVKSITLEMGLYERYYDGLFFESKEGIEFVDDSNMVNDIGAMIELLSIDEKPPIYFVPFNSVRMGFLYPDDLFCLPKTELNSLLVEGTEKMYYDQEAASKGFHFWDLVTLVSESSKSFFETVPVTAEIVSDEPSYPGAKGALKLANTSNLTSNLFVKRMPLKYESEIFENTQIDPATQGVLFPQFDAYNKFDDALLTQFALNAYYAFYDANLQLAINNGSQLDGSSVADVLIGYQEADQLIGFSGDDILTGQGGRDYLSGGDGDDFLCGGIENDTLEGGYGSDTFVVGFGVDIILDFNACEGDRVAMRNFQDIKFQQVGQDLTISSATGEVTAILLNTTLQEFDSDLGLVLYGK